MGLDRPNQFAMNFSPFSSQRRITFYSSLKIPRNFHSDKINILRFALWRNKKNMNTIMLICGSVRTGKSYNALRLGEDYTNAQGKEFDVRNQCSFEVLPFLKWSKQATDNLYILDEVGNTLNAQDWYKVQSKIMRNFVYAQGFRRNVLIVVLPNTISFMKSFRSMVNYSIKTKEQGFGTWYKNNVDYLTGKIMRPYYMGNIKFSLPSENVIKEYEEMKKEWNDTQLKEDIEQIESMKETRYYTMPKDMLIKAVQKGMIEQDKFVNDMTSKGFRKSDSELMYKLALKLKKNKYPHVCSQCYNEWESNTEKPQRCPNCNTRNWQD